MHEVLDEEERQYRIARDRIVDQWVARRITRAEKRRQIAELNLFRSGKRPEPERVLVPATSPSYQDDEPERYWWQDD
jgi:hypothetical protein